MDPKIEEVVDTISPQITALSHKILEYLESGMDMAADQAPLLITEILNWAIVVGSFWALVAAGFIAITWVIAKKLWRFASKEDDELLFFLAVLVPFVFGSIGTVVFVNSLMRAAKALITPRLYLIEYFSDLVK